MRKRGKWAGMLSVVAVACSGTPSEREITYERDVRPLVEENCTTCHRQGGIGPFSFDEWSSVEEHRGLMVGAVTSGIMPPWPADETCHPLSEVRRLSASAKETFRRWQQGGYLRGDPAEYRAPEKAGWVDPGEPSRLIRMAEPYVPPTSVTDEYRCFLIADTFDADTFVTVMDIRPGNKRVVHHVQMHVIPASSIAQVEQLDAAAPEPGYPCAIGIPGSYNMFSWRPGTLPVGFEPGDAGLVDAGSRIELQVHYNMEHLAPGEAPEGDVTELALWTLPAGALPDRIVRRKGAMVLPLSIPAGEPHVVVEQQWTGGVLSAVGPTLAAVPAQIIGETPHMHALGTRLSATRTDEAGNSMCLADVPRWDFTWQFDYAYASDAAVALGQNDLITVRCEYDNSAENQQLDASGALRAPRDVGFGEGTSDEMCLNYVWLRYDRQAFLEAR